MIRTEGRTTDQIISERAKSTAETIHLPFATVSCEADVDIDVFKDAHEERKPVASFDEGAGRIDGIIAASEA